MRTETALPENIERHEDTSKNESLRVIPDFLTFGCLCQGFVYRLTFTIVNTCVKSQKFKNKIVPIDSNDNNLVDVTFDTQIIAPGLSVNIVIELRAEVAVTSTYELSIFEQINNSCLKKRVVAHIVPKNVFRQIARAERLQKKSIYLEGVRPVGRIPGDGSVVDDDMLSRSTGRSVGVISTTTSQNVFGQASKNAVIVSETEIDAYDAEDILDMPLLPNLYWDPVDKLLKIDEELSMVSSFFTT
jgi:hypothetical protein